MARASNLDDDYLPPTYRIIAFIDELRLDLRERRFAAQQRRERLDSQK